MDFTEWKGVSVLSGGSFSYLCYKDVCDLMQPSGVSELESMALHLMDMGYEDIARDTQRLVEYIKSASLTIEVLSQQLMMCSMLSNGMRAVTGEETVA